MAPVPVKAPAVETELALPGQCGGDLDDDRLSR